MGLGGSLSWVNMWEVLKWESGRAEYSKISKKVYAVLDKCKMYFFFKVYFLNENFMQTSSTLRSLIIPFLSM